MSNWFPACLILALLVTSSLEVEARRRSRIDSPIQPAAEAPLEDNLATASGNDEVVATFEKLPTVTAKAQTKEKVEDENLNKQGPCNADLISFELVTGWDNILLVVYEFIYKLWLITFRYMLSSSEKMLDATPLLMLSECLDQCRLNTSCNSVNYETGLCVLFSSSADQLKGKA